MSFIATIIGKSSFSDQNAEESAKNFHKAMKGIGTDEKLIIKELAEHTNEQRQIVKEKYLSMYGKELVEDLKSELRGEFEEVVTALLKPRSIYEAENLRDAIHGAGTNEKLVIEILCTKEGPEIREISEAYKTLYNSDLENDIKGEADGPLGRVFRSLAVGDRPVSGVDVDLAKKEAQELYDAGAGKFGTDECEFVRILVSRSFNQLRETFEAYFRISGKDIEHSIKSETSGDFEEALVTIVESIRNRPAYFAKRLQEAMQGVGTKDKHLIRIVVSRSEVDMVDVRREYKRLFNHSLYDELKKELSGDYEDLILKLVGKD